MAYNVQSTVDAKHNLPINYEVTNENDSKAMGGMLEQAVEILGNNDFTAVFDKGYHTGSEFETTNQLGVEVLVAIPDLPSSSMAPDPAYDLCTKSQNKRGRVIERSIYVHLLEANKKRMAENYETYKKRQVIVEHPFGTIKRQWGFDYIMTKKFKKRASADVGFIFTAYNLRRIFNIIGTDLLKEYLKGIFFPFYRYLRDFQAFIDFIFLKIKLLVYAENNFTTA